MAPSQRSSLRANGGGCRRKKSRHTSQTSSAVSSPPATAAPLQQPVALELELLDLAVQLGRSRGLVARRGSRLGEAGPAGGDRVGRFALDRLDVRHQQEDAE